MPQLSTLVPGKDDRENNNVTIRDINELGQTTTAPNLNNYDDIEMEVRDSKKNLVATYANSSGSVSSQPYKLEIDSNQDNRLIFDIYKEDTDEKVPGIVYANVTLVMNQAPDYPDGYEVLVPFIKIAKFTKSP